MEYEPEVWRERYREDGFVVVRDLLDPSTLAGARAALERIVRGHGALPPPLGEKIFFEREHVKNNPQWYAGVLAPEDCGDSVRQIADLALFDQALAALITYPPALDVIETLFESSDFAFNSIFGRPKAARVGNGISNGNFHRDTPFEDFTQANVILCILCLDEMTDENGATTFIRGSHKVSDEEARETRWRAVAPEELNPDERVVARCPAGSGIFFNTKILHAAGHNRSARTRYTILCEWVGPGVRPTSPDAHAFQGLRPRAAERVRAGVTRW